METLERIKAEVERLRGTKGITFNEMVCYANVLRIIEIELSHKPLEGGQWGNLMREPQYRIDLGRIHTNEQ
jgi:hypothetical protein